MSAVFPNLPSGAMIVIVCSTLFFFSLLFGRSRGVLVRFARRWRLNRVVDRQHLLRGMYELLETHESKHELTPIPVGISVPFAQLLEMRTWSSFRLSQEIARCCRDGLLIGNAGGYSLSETGLEEASRLAHEHRLWEIYLITQADVAPGRVDQAADTIEHVLEPELIAQLEELLEQQRTSGGVVASPHQIAATEGLP